MKVELRKVSKDYRSGGAIVHAIRDMSLTIKKGEFLALMGPSGSGKTTALNIMGALDRPTRGEVYLDGQEVGTMAEWRRSRLRLGNIGFIFQEFNLIPSMTALDNVKLPLSGLAPFRATNRSKALGLLKRVDMDDKARRYPSQLSGGEQQRVAIARALANDPSLLLADEPTGELDSESTQRVMEIFRELNSDEGRTVVLVTHDPEVSKRARRIMKVRDGRMTF